MNQLENINDTSNKIREEMLYYQKRNEKLSEKYSVV